MDKKSLCIHMLTERARDLGRLPKKSDFEPDTVIDIKRTLGPWPRALEIAGLKPVSGQKKKCRKFYYAKPK